MYRRGQSRYRFWTSLSSLLRTRFALARLTACPAGRDCIVALEKGRVDVARQLVQTVTLPNLLSAQSLAYLHWIRGVLATADPVNLAIAEQEMQLAVDGRLRTSNDRCLATATLAEIVALSQDFNRANSLLDNASKIPHSTAARDYIDTLRARFREAK